VIVAGGCVVVSTVRVSPVEETDENVETDVVTPGADVVVAGGVVIVLSGGMLVVVTEE
jgi:hypothetical protein